MMRTFPSPQQVSSPLVYAQPKRQSTRTQFNPTKTPFRHNYDGDGLDHRRSACQNNPAVLQVHSRGVQGLTQVAKERLVSSAIRKAVFILSVITPPRNNRALGIKITELSFKV